MQLFTNYDLMLKIHPKLYFSVEDIMDAGDALLKRNIPREHDAGKAVEMEPSSVQNTKHAK